MGRDQHGEPLRRADPQPVWRRRLHRPTGRNVVDAHQHNRRYRHAHDVADGLGIDGNTFRATREVRHLGDLQCAAHQQRVPIEVTERGHIVVEHSAAADHPR